MRMKSCFSWSAGVLILAASLASPVWAQFTANIQGTVVDQSGAAVAQAKVDLVNTITRVAATTTTDASGSYRFLSLAPGSYKIAVEAKGFSKSETSFTLQTNENLNLPISLKVGAATESVVVTAEPPLFRVWAWERPANYANNEVRHRYFPRSSQRLLQLPENVCGHGVHRRQVLSGFP